MSLRVEAADVFYGPGRWSEKAWAAPVCRSSRYESRAVFVSGCLFRLAA